MDSNFKPIGTLIHGIAASEHLDSSGERISIRGLDISSLERDGIFNHEHKNEVPDQIVGKILKAKKIFSEEDCETPEELYFWNKSQAPYVYVMGELFDGVGHKGAQEIAAMLKYDYIARQQNRPGLNVVNFSIEGSKLNKEGQEITKALARKVTITTAACNKVAVAELFDPAKFSKKESILDFAKSEKLGVDMIKKNAKKLPTTQNVSAKTNRILSPEGVKKAIKGVKKAITADSGLTAPSAKTGGTALIPESIEKDIQKLPNFEKFLKFIQSKYPGMSKNEAEAMAKYFTARAMIKAEESLEKIVGQDLNKSKNVRKQIKKIFDTDANAPRLSDKRIKMMQQIRDFVERKFGMPMVVAEGKRDSSGQIREDKNNQPAYEEAKDKYEQDYNAWRTKAKELPINSTEYWAHIKNKPNLPKSEMEKGAARRLHGKFDPMKLPAREKVKEWQTSTGFLQDLDPSYDDERHQDVREELPKMDPGQKMRALNKLSNKTLTRRHPKTGERQFLLFRGIGQDEFHTISGPHIHNPSSRSSWTPYIKVAKDFEMERQNDHDDTRTIAAWINESDIHAAPYMYGNIPDLEMDNGRKFYVPDERLKGKNEFANEHEIIVKPHKSMRATKGDVKRYEAIHNPNKKNIRISDPKKDLNARINWRGEQQKLHEKSTKKYPIIRTTSPIPSAAPGAAGMGMKKPKKMAASEEENE